MRVRFIVYPRRLLMTEPQLSVRSAKAWDLAYRLAKCEGRSVKDIVERALEAYELRVTGREPPASFYARISAASGTDLDLEAMIRQGRKTHPGIEI
jgi:hypothetical protein